MFLLNDCKNEFVIDPNLAEKDTALIGMDGFRVFISALLTEASDGVDA